MRNQINTQIHTITENFTRTNDRVLDTVVDANRKAVDFAVKTFDSVELPTMPTLPVEVPFADRLELPTAAQAGDRYLDFVERAVEMNRDFSKRIVAMLDVEEAKKPAATKPAAKKTTAKKTTAKKTTAKKATARKAAAKK